MHNRESNCNGRKKPTEMDDENGWRRNTSIIMNWFHRQLADTLNYELTELKEIFVADMRSYGSLYAEENFVIEFCFMLTFTLKFI